MAELRRNDPASPTPAPAFQALPPPTRPRQRPRPGPTGGRRRLQHRGQRPRRCRPPGGSPPPPGVPYPSAPLPWGSPRHRARSTGVRGAHAPVSPSPLLALLAGLRRALCFPHPGRAPGHACPALQSTGSEAEPDSGKRSGVRGGTGSVGTRCWKRPAGSPVAAVALLDLPLLPLGAPARAEAGG